MFTNDQTGFDNDDRFFSELKNLTGNSIFFSEKAVLKHQVIQFKDCIGYIMESHAIQKF